MKNKKKKLLSSIIAWGLVVVNMMTGVGSAGSVYAANAGLTEAGMQKQELAVVSDVPKTSAIPQITAEEGEYQIYPTPHNVTYSNGTFTVGEVNLVYDSTVSNDAAITGRMEQILRDKGIAFSSTNTVVDGKTNILVGTNSSGSIVKSTAESLATIDSTHMSKEAAHYVISKNNKIVVLGKDADATFYGVTTLKHIFSQMAGNTIRQFEIKDYADTKIRGFIEGYYGIPWSNEDRMSLMRFGGDFKMTSYIFAPKDDPYHTTKWRELYPADEIAAIEEMARVGNDSKCRFVWTAHPFMGGFNNNDVNGEIQALLNKFEQLYTAGVRQFGVLGDDVGSLNRSTVVQVVNAVADWAEGKGDVYDTVFCPAGYCQWMQAGSNGGNYAELNLYDQEFRASVQIFWTGNEVCAPINNETLTYFRTRNANNGVTRRPPLFWLNWPVNDINHHRMMIGKGELLNTDVDPNNLIGMVTNPMQEAEASKNALFAISDFSWNVKSFNVDKSWKDGFHYIDPDTGDELYVMAQHMSDPSPNGQALVLDESVELKPLLEGYLSDGTNGQQLIEEFEKIAAACDGFLEKTKNENLKEELLPFACSLRDQALAGANFVKAAEAIEAGQDGEAWDAYSYATSYETTSKNYQKDKLDNGRIVKISVTPGSKRITPFINAMSSKLSPLILPLVDESRQVITLHTNRSDSPVTHAGAAVDAVANLMDNNTATEIIFKTPNSVASGDYVGLLFTRAFNLTSIEFKLGQAQNDEDTFQSAKLQYTENGTSWTDLEGTSYTDGRTSVSKTGLNLNVKGIRIISTAAKTNMWLGIKDIVINGGNTAGITGNPVSSALLTGSLIVPSGYTTYSGVFEELSDDNINSYMWFDVPDDSCKVGDYVGLDLGSPQKMGKVIFAMPEGELDVMSNYTLQYSNDGTNYTDIATYTDKSINVDISHLNIEARYIRVKNNIDTGKWLKVCELYVIKGSSTSIYTNKDAQSVASYSITRTENTNTLTGTQALTMAPGDYIGIDLVRIRDVSSIEASYIGELTLQSSANGIVWYEHTLMGSEQIVLPSRFVRLINNGNTNTQLNLTSLKVESREVFPISVKETNFGLERGYQETHLLAFDGDRTTEAVLATDQAAGLFITYDLGQWINLESLKLVFQDTTPAFPRHAKVWVSEDATQWNEVMVIGNQDSDNPGEAENQDLVSDLFPDHEISYFTRTSDNINRRVRYIKFELTRAKAGEARWVRIREIELNGGDMYLSSNNDPTVESTSQESSKNLYSYVNDGDLSTGYRPVGDKAGSLIYRFPQKEELRQITIMQNISTVFDSDVYAEVIEEGVLKTVDLGLLTNSLNKFDVSQYDAVTSVTIKWEDNKVPEIREILLGRKEDSKDIPEIIIIDTDLLKEEIAITISGDGDKVYDGMAIDSSSFTVSGLPEDMEVSYEYYRKLDSGWEKLESAPSKVGNYGICASIADIDIKCEIHPFEITKAPLTIKDVVVNLSSETDGEEKLQVDNVLFNGLVEGEVLSLGTDYEAVLTYDAGNLDISDNEGSSISGESATTISVTVTVTLKDIEKANNYELPVNVFEKDIQVGYGGEPVEPGVSDNDPSASDNNPGSSDNDPSTSDNEPGVSDNDPSASDNNPGSSDNAPSTSDNDPGVSDNDPSTSDNDPEITQYENIWIKGLEDKVYTGTKILQNLKVYDGDKLLIENADYTISYKNNVNACEFKPEELEAFEEAYRNDPKTKANIGNHPSKKVPQVVLKMKGNYSGTRSFFFQIERADISNEDSFIIDDLTVTGTGKNKAPVPAVTWKDTGKNLKNKKDYTVTESSDSEGRILIVEGKNNFTGSQIIRYDITPDKNTVALNDVKVSKLKAVDYKEGESLKPIGFTVKYKKVTLTEGTHFRVSEVTADDIMGNGTATMVLTAIEEPSEGGYTFKGSKRVSFKVNTYAMSKVKASGLKGLAFAGDKIEPLSMTNEKGEPVVKLTIPGTKTLAERILTEDDYTVSYEKNMSKGTASIILTGKPEKGVTGTKKLTFKIGAADLSNANGEGSEFDVTLSSDVSGSDNVVYYTKGGAKPAVLIVREDGQALVEGRDYTVTYKKHKAVGTATAEVKGKGNYTGKFPLSYKIEPKPVSEDDTNGVWIVVTDKPYSTKKNSWKQSFQVWDSDGKALANKKDADIKGAVYTVYSLGDNAPAGVNIGDELTSSETVLPIGSQVKITVKMQGNNYRGEVTGIYEIIDETRTISMAKFKIKPQQYTGEAVIIDSNDDFQKAELERTALTLEGEEPDIEIVEGSYINNIKKGTAKVTIRGVGEYGGIKTVTFKIVARNITDGLDESFTYWK